MEDPAKTLRRWLPFRKPSPQCRARLFCLPFGGGGASAYRPWQSGLPAWIEVCAVQLPGREGRLAEAPAVDLSVLVAEIDAALSPLFDDGTPFALYGHSLGGVIAFELARARRRATPPRHLFVGASPRAREPGEPLVSEMSRAELVETLRRWNGTSPELLDNAEVMDVILPAFRADHALIERYHAPPERLDLPLTAFGGAADPFITERHLQSWAEACGSFRCRMLPGDHFFAFPTHPQILAEIAAALEAT